MRVIWRDLGTMLDLMFCNCVGYPLSHTCRFEEYVAWVRSRELQGGFFYLDGASSVGDKRFLERRYADEVKATIVPAPVPPATPSPAQQALVVALAALRPISAFYALAPIFPANAGGDIGVLLRSTCDILRGVSHDQLMQFLPKDVQESNAAMLEWYRPDPPGQTQQGGGLTQIVRSDVQGGILHTYPGITWGRLILLRVIDGIKAARSLAKWLPTSASEQGGAEDGTLYRLFLRTASWSSSVRQVFTDQLNYSVSGSGSRMSQSLGLGYLGQDSDAGHDEPAKRSNEALASV